MSFLHSSPLPCSNLPSFSPGILSLTTPTNRFFLTPHPLPYSSHPSLSPGIHLQTIHHNTHILAWWYTCRNVTWLFFLRRMKKNCNRKYINQVPFIWRKVVPGRNVISLPEIAFSLRCRRNLNTVSNVCEATPISLFWASKGLTGLPEMRDEFPSNLIAILTMAF